MSRVFGELDGYPEGEWFDSRKSLSASGIHRPTQAGICGSPDDGAESIVLSGGYEDDIDNGDVIIYTGHGGRDASSGAQVEDQTLARQNLALVKNKELGIPVRVVRGYEHPSEYSPKTGYRYDGLYEVEDYWKAQGKSGFKIYHFRLVKKNTEPPVPTDMALYRCSVCSKRVLGYEAKKHKQEVHHSQKVEWIKLI